MANGGNANGAPAGDLPPGIPFYEKQRQHLKELLARRRVLERSLAQTEESIYTKETDYLESTPQGNIIVGFEHYTKGPSSAAAQRQRKAGQTDANRVFSRSSVSYQANGDAVTPGSAPSGAPTPASATAKDTAETSQPAPAPSTSSKSKKKKAVAATEDSETESRETKKVRTSFGANRK